MGGGDAGDLGVVVGGRDLDDVGADQVEPGERRAAWRAVRGWSGRPPRACRCRARAPGRARRCRPRRRPGGRRPGRRSARPCLRRPGARPRGTEITWKPSSASSAQVGARRTSGPRMPTCRQPVGRAGPPRRPPERRAVGVRRRRSRCPRCRGGRRSARPRPGRAGGDRAQQRQRDGVVAAEGQQRGARSSRLARRALDRGDRLVDVERVDGDVAGVGDLLGGERRHVERRVVGPQQPRRLPDVRRAEAGAGPVGDAAVERHADDGDVGPAAPRRSAAAGRRSPARRTAGTSRSTSTGPTVLAVVDDPRDTGCRSW